MEAKEAIKAILALITFIEEHPGYKEFEDDLYSFLDSLNEEEKNGS